MPKPTYKLDRGDTCKQCIHREGYTCESIGTIWNLTPIMIYQRGLRRFMYHHRCTMFNPAYFECVLSPAEAERLAKEIIHERITDRINKPYNRFEMMMKHKRLAGGETIEQPQSCQVTIEYHRRNSKLLEILNEQQEADEG